MKDRYRNRVEWVKEYLELLNLDEKFFSVTNAIQLNGFRCFRQCYLVWKLYSTKFTRLQGITGQEQN